MDINDFEKEILNFIKTNNGVCDLNSVFVHFFPLLKEMNETTDFVKTVVLSLITTDVIKINQNGMFEVTQKVPFISSTESKSMNIGSDQITIKLSEEQTNTLKLIKERFKNYFGIDLTEQQAVDRVFRIVKDYMDCGIPQMRNQPVRSFGETECRVFADTNWNQPPHGVNMNTPFNPPPNWVGSSGLNPLNKPENFFKIQPNQSFNNSFKCSKNPQEGPYAHLYPGFRNMILSDHEAEDNTEAMRAGLIRAGLLNEPKKKRTYTKKPKK